ncbi:glutathione gamma-glutamylcysteinyltransferase [Aureococcus anophagefferens]|nr:glutathione gamma-glutamylcysteinyltransferase [Aureococcus anophagefferens]
MAIDEALQVRDALSQSTASGDAIVAVYKDAVASLEARVAGAARRRGEATKPKKPRNVGARPPMVWFCDPARAASARRVVVAGRSGAIVRETEDLASAVVVVLPRGVEASAVGGSMPEFYKRPLPDSCVAFDSKEGRAHFESALSSGGLENFFVLAPQFQTQNEPAFCGLAALALTRSSGLEAAPLRRRRLPVAAFRDAVADACARTDVVLAASYSRKTLGQTGDGHFSCVGGYDRASDGAPAIILSSMYAVSGDLAARAAAGGRRR